MSTYFRIILFGYFLLFTCCNSDDAIVIDDATEDEEEEIVPHALKILSLGDSYTIGENVCASCRFPEQLKDSLAASFPVEDSFNVNIIAQTGWTTTSLKNAITNENPSNNNNLVTLLIGVNNQFQGRPFSLYEAEFPELVHTAISLANNDKSNLIVVSIPDYAFTPFGQGTGNPANTSLEIDQYNAFAENYCNSQDITFINITDITRLGLDNPDLVASDGLHPSELAYSKFVERLLPIAIEKIE